MIIGERVDAQAKGKNGKMCCFLFKQYFFLNEFLLASLGPLLTGRLVVS